MKPNKPAKRSKKNNEYSVTEVGAMLENIHKEIKTIAEGHSGLDQKLEDLAVEVHGNSRRLEMVELTCRVTKDKVTHLEDAVSKLNRDVAKLDSELKETREELKKEIHQLGDRIVAVEANR